MSNCVLRQKYTNSEWKDYYKQFFPGSIGKPPLRQSLVKPQSLTCNFIQAWNPSQIFNEFFVFLSRIFPYMQATTRKYSLEVGSLHIFKDTSNWLLPCGWWSVANDELQFITSRSWKIVTFIHETLAQLKCLQSFFGTFDFPTNSEDTGIKLLVKELQLD